MAAVAALAALLSAGPSLATVTLLAAVSLHDNSAQPPPDAAAWEAQRLPDNWNITRPGIGGTVWYRFDYRIDDPSSVYAVYLPRLSMNGAVYVNGAAAGEKEEGASAEAVSTMANAPVVTVRTIAEMARRARVMFSSSAPVVTTFTVS